MHVRRLAVPALLASALAVSLWCPGAAAQDAAAPELKAAFLLNFARFSEWPDPVAGSPIVLCVFGDDRVAFALSAVTRGQHIQGRPLDVSRIGATAAVRVCHLLFVSGSDLSRATALLESAKALPVLTVSDGEHFTQSGGMVELFVDAGRMRFAVNVDAVQRARLRLSSRLLGLSTIVRERNVQ